jgi:hypothetical protein
MTGVKVVKPSNCSVSGGELTTAALTAQVIMDPTAGSTAAFTRFSPENAATGFMTIEFTGALCPLAEDTGTLKGNVCGEAVHTNAGGTGFEPNKTGTLTSTTIVVIGNAHDITANSAAKPCGQTLNGAAAQVSGAVDTTLASGKPFGAD